MNTTAISHCREKYMNPFITSMTLEEVPHKRVYPSHIKVGDTIAVFISTSSLVCDGYWTWKKVSLMAHNNLNYRWRFTDGTSLGQYKKSAAKLEVLK